MSSDREADLVLARLVAELPRVAAFVPETLARTALELARERATQELEACGASADHRQRYAAALERRRRQLGIDNAHDGGK